MDNNLTRKVSLTDASYIAMSKGLAAGATNLALALALALAAGAAWPGLEAVLAAGTLGFVSYGASLVLFVLGLRHLGNARTGAYFSIAPFVGAALAIGLLGEDLSWQLGLAVLLMAIGVALHLTEKHEHEHQHEAIEHAHEHDPDDLHHDHVHEPRVPAGTRHAHRHRHERIRHRHAHFPDMHHRHEH